MRMVLASIVAMPVLWLGSAFLYERWNTYTHRFRIVVEIETPTGVKFGSSVIQVSASEKADWIPQTGGVLNTVQGEAVFVDLGEGRNVVALLARGPTANIVDIHDLAPRAFGRLRADWYREASAWSGNAELHGDLMPTLLTFSDYSNPQSARVLRPDETPEALGPGYRFRRATIEMVPSGWWPANVVGLSGTPVSQSIEDKLVWWNKSGRPAAVALRSAGSIVGSSIDAEQLFRRN